MTWACAACTYENAAGSAACEICLAKRPERGAAAARVWTFTDDHGHWRPMDGATVAALNLEYERLVSGERVVAGGRTYTLLGLPNGAGDLFQQVNNSTGRTRTCMATRPAAAAPASIVRQRPRVDGAAQPPREKTVAVAPSTASRGRSSNSGRAGAAAAPAASTRRVRTAAPAARSGTSPERRHVLRAAAPPEGAASQVTRRQALAHRHDAGEEKQPAVADADGGQVVPRHVLYVANLPDGTTKASLGRELAQCGGTIDLWRGKYAFVGVSVAGGGEGGASGHRVLEEVVAKIKGLGSGVICRPKEDKRKAAAPKVASTSGAAGGGGDDRTRGTGRAGASRTSSGQRGAAAQPDASTQSKAAPPLPARERETGEVKRVLEDKQCGFVAPDTYFRLDSVEHYGLGVKPGDTLTFVLAEQKGGGRMRALRPRLCRLAGGAGSGAKARAALIGRDETTWSSAWPEFPEFYSVVGHAVAGASGTDAIRLFRLGNTRLPSRLLPRWLDCFASRADKILGDADAALAERQQFAVEMVRARPANIRVLRRGLVAAGACGGTGSGRVFDGRLWEALAEGVAAAAPSLLRDERAESVTTAAGDLDVGGTDLVPRGAELLRPRECSSLPVVPAAGKEFRSAQAYVATMFELLRADCFHELQAGLAKLVEGCLDSRDMHTYSLESFAAVHAERDVLAWSVLVKPRRGEQRDGMMMPGNLVCLAAGGAFDTGRVFWATVAPAARGRAAAAAAGAGGLSVRLCFFGCGGTDAFSALAAEPAGSVVVAESPTFYVAYRPLLEGLQQLWLRVRGQSEAQQAQQAVDLAAGRSISGSDDRSNPVLWFEDELVRMMPRARPTATEVVLPDAGPELRQRLSRHVAAVQRPPPRLLEHTVDWTCLFRPAHAPTTGSERVKVSRLLIARHDPAHMLVDASQFEAIKHCMRQRLAVVQGPPGTGKSWVGVKLLTLLLSMEPPLVGPVLVVTYKNHVLDEFVCDAAEALRSLGHEPAGLVARLGGGSKNDTVSQHYLMRECREAQKRKGGRDPLAGQLHEELKEAWEAVDEAREDIRVASNTISEGGSWDVAELLDTFGQREQVATLCAQRGAAFEAAVAKWLPQRHVDDFCRRWSLAFETMGDEVAAAGAGAQAAAAAGAGAGAGADAPPASREADDEISAALAAGAAAEALEEREQRQAELDSRPAARQVLSGSGDGDSAERKEAAQGAGDDEDAGFSLVAGRRSKGKRKQRADNKDRRRRPGGPAATTLHVDEAVRAAWKVMGGADGQWRSSADLPDMSPLERVRYVVDVAMASASKSEGRMTRAVAAFEEAAANMRGIRTKMDAAVLRRARVVAATVTGAAKNRELLEAASPPVMMVEEAAEVLEAQVLGCMPASVRHAVLVGDHEQLRPGVNNHLLPRHNNFVSLFERLATADRRMPSVRLTRQNRMRPEMVHLLRHIYPNLETNHDAVAGNVKPPMLRWEQGAMHLWTSAGCGASMNETPASRSHRNEGEARAVCFLARWLVHAGHDPARITVLAAYKGQHHLLKGLLAKAAPGVTSVHTIDKYQGDENDFVIVSLVRRGHGRIGFVGEQNRLCVSLSRARCGLVVVGDHALLESKSKSWKFVVKQFREHGAVQRELFLTCPWHRGSAVGVRVDGVPAAVPAFCTRECGQDRPACGHTCNAPCHAAGAHPPCDAQVRFKHSACGHDDTRPCYKQEDAVVCAMPCPKRCEKGTHPCTKKCGEPCAASCEQCEAAERAEVERARDELLARAERERERQREAEARGVAVSRTQLAREADEWNTVHDDVMRRMQPAHGYSLRVVGIERVVNHNLAAKQLEAWSKLKDPRRPTTRLFHGTRAEAAASICEGGFRLPDRGRRNMFGRGVYFATDSTKSAQGIYTGEGGESVLLVCDVALGKSKEVNTAQPRYPPHRRQRDFDTLYAKRNTTSTGGVRFDEYVVYEPELAVPLYVVRFSRNAARPIPRPPNGNVRVPLKKHGDPDDPLVQHFKLAEAQFLRMSAADRSRGSVEEVELVNNAPLEQKYREAEDKAKADGTFLEVREVFHGTSPEALTAIAEEGFRVGGDGGVPIRHGAAHGRGVYSSEDPAVAQGYIRGGQRFILCKLCVTTSTTLVGGSLDDRNRAIKMFVQPNAALILPAYIVTFGRGNN